MIYSDGSHREDAKYLTAALRAAAEATGQPAIITQRDVATLGSEADWIIWLADGDVPDSLLAQTRRGATLLTYTTADSSSPRHITFSTRFHPSSSDFVLQPAFPESIAALWTGPTPEPLRPVSHSQLLPARATGISPASPKGRDLYHAFWLAAVVLFLLERALARRARAVAA